MQLLETVRSWFPADCVLCGFAVHGTASLCRDCRDRLPVTGPTCQRCGLNLPGQSPGDTCGRCLLNPPPFDGCMSAFRYEQPISGLITSFKFHGDFASGRTLAGLLAEAFCGHYGVSATGRLGPVLPDLLVPIPLHRKRLRERGFNQALLLARAISSQTGIPLSPDLLVRERDTVSQSLLQARHRHHNLAGAFVCHSSRRRAIPGHVAIIDDVITTTATVSAAAKTLRAGGAQRIDVWSVARAQ